MILSENTRKEILSDIWLPFGISGVLIVVFIAIGYWLELKFHNDWFARIGALLVGTGVIIDMVGIMYSLNSKFEDEPKITYRMIKVAMLVAFFGTLLWAFGDLFTVCETMICLKNSA